MNQNKCPRCLSKRMQQPPSHLVKAPNAMFLPTLWQSDVEIEIGKVHMRMYMYMYHI